MRFPLYFKRGKGAADEALYGALGGDTTPTVSTKQIAGKTNCLSHRIVKPIHRIAVAHWYEGAGAIVTLPVVLWVYDMASEKWFQASSGTLTNGQITYLKCPVLDVPSQVQANMGTPAQSIDAMIVVADNTAGDGVYHFVAGPDQAQF
jgi:hypothetical protein